MRTRGITFIPDVCRDELVLLTGSRVGGLADPGQAALISLTHK
jgi:hypothetical protein